jgi:hypothetical protein
VSTFCAIDVSIAEMYQAPREEVERDIIELLQDLADKGTVAA